ncbi:MAG: ribonuclease P protein component [Planctomycetaceae bacterium]|nr:ribonuclease P protein component [Planctomycetaceae bacterium]
MQLFSKLLRLRCTREFERVFSARAAVADEFLIVFILPNNLQVSRLGLSVSRKVGNSVVRNRWKRLIREAFRKNCRSFPQCIDLIVLPQRKAQPPNGKKIEFSFKKLITRAFKRISTNRPSGNTETT